MLSKRGQITTFLVIGIIILFVAGFVLYIREQIVEQPLIKKPIGTNVEPINFFVISCLTDITEQTLVIIGKQGGYYKIPDEISSSFFMEDLPYYYLNGQQKVPTLYEIQNEISKGIQDKFLGCIKNFESFTNEGYKINAQNFTVNAKITDKNLAISLFYPLDIENVGAKTRLENFETIIPLDIKQINNVSLKLVDMYSKKPGFICLTCFDDLQLNNTALDLQMIPLFGETLLIENAPEPNELLMAIITDNSFKIDGKSFTYRFYLDYKII